MIQPVAIPSAAAALLLLSVAAAPASAAFVSADTTTTAMGEAVSIVGSFSVDNLSDGSCLNDPGNLESNCAADDSSGSNGYTWVSSLRPPGAIDFAFGTALEFVGASIWNLNTGALSNAAFNVQEIALSWSLDGSAFLPLTFSVNGGASGSSGVLTQVPSSNDTTSPDLIAFDPIVLDVIRLDITSNFGGAVVGLSEVAFDAAAPTPNPAPATLLLLAPAVLWLGLRRGKPLRR